MMSRRLAYAVIIAGATTAVALAQPAPTASRGELLYNTHCIACHTTEVHWRDQKLATDWASLVHQVRRWADNTGLAWSDEEVADVARYLNATYYRFAAPSVTGAVRAPDEGQRTVRASVSPSDSYCAFALRTAALAKPKTSATGRTSGRT